MCECVFVLVHVCWSARLRDTNSAKRQEGYEVVVDEDVEDDGNVDVDVVVEIIEDNDGR